MLVVLVARPAAAPPPSMRGKEAYHRISVMHHPRAVAGAVGIRRARSGRDMGSGYIGVLDRIQVDCAAEGVLRPARRPADEPAVERRGVVGRYRPVVVGTV